MWMLDTDICSYILRDQPKGIQAHFDRIDLDQLAISSVVLAELQFGVARLPSPGKLHAAVNDFAGKMHILAWDENAAAHYAKLRTTLERRGTPIEAMDLMIAAHALSEDAILVSNNTSHFARVPGLKLENWT